MFIFNHCSDKLSLTRGEKDINEHFFLYFYNTGQNTHFLLSILVKHLDHKNVLKQPDMQLDIVKVATSLAQDTKTLGSVAIIGAVTDIMRHLRKSIHYSLDDANLGADLIKWNREFREAVDECLVQLSCKVRLPSIMDKYHSLQIFNC